MKYMLKNLIHCLLLIISISMLTFFLVQVSPVDPIDAYFGADSVATKEQKAIIAEKWGLNDSVPIRFVKWGSSLLRGDFGQSYFFQRSVLEIVKSGVQNSFYLMFTAWILSGIFGFILGIIAAVFRERWPDLVIRVICYLFSSTPTFWVGILVLLLFSVTLGWFPIGLSAPIGLTVAEASWGQRLHHMLLPSLTLSVIGISSITLHTREKMIEVLESDYALFATARGEKRWSIVKKHGLRNIMLPAITLQFGSINELFGGSVLVENVFTYAGLGSIMVTAGIKGDLPLLMGITIISAVIIFIGNLIANLLYPIVDPRSKEDYLS